MENVVKFYVHISPVFSCRVTYFVIRLAINSLLANKNNKASYKIAVAI